VVLISLVSTYVNSVIKSSILNTPLPPKEKKNRNKVEVVFLFVMLFIIMFIWLNSFHDDIRIVCKQKICR
jgi:hypothetical protein